MENDDGDDDGDDNDEDGDDDDGWCMVGFPVTPAVAPQGLRAPGHFPEHQIHSSIEIHFK